MTTTETPIIRSKYTDNQLRDALITATELRERIFIRGTVGADGAYGSKHWSEDQINDLHAILNVLDTLNDAEGTDAGEDSQHGVLQAASDEWEPANLETIHMTDEAVLVLYADGTGLQGTPDGIGEDDLYITVHGQQHHVDRADLVEGRAWLYRIPAPIVHPDPGVHPVILVYEIEGDPLMAPASYHWHFDHNHYKPIINTRMFSLPPEAFTKWEPADIVPKATGESDG